MGIGDEQLVPDELLFDRVGFSHETINFINNTPMGRSMFAQAFKDYREAVMDFEDLTVHDITHNVEKVLEVHQRLNAAKSFLKWIDSTIKSGDSAEEELKMRDESDRTID